MDTNSCIEMFNTAIAKAIEEPVEGRRQLRELQVKFLKGELCATHTHYGHMYNDHIHACRDALVKLNSAGVFTDGGQERSYMSEQRGYICGNFLTRSTVEHVQEMFDALDCSYVFHDGTRYYIRLCGCDYFSDVKFVTNTTNDLKDVLSKTTGQDFIFVTSTFTNVDVNIDDVFGLSKHGDGTAISFMAWDSTWPVPGEEADPSVTARLADMVLAPNSPVML